MQGGRIAGAKAIDVFNPLVLYRNVVCVLCTKWLPLFFLCFFLRDWIWAVALRKLFALALQNVGHCAAGKY